MFGRYNMFAHGLRMMMQRTCLFLLCIVFLGLSAAQAAEFSLIVEPEGGQAVMHVQRAAEKGLFKSAMRWRRVDLLKQLVLPDGITKGDELVLNLFPDTSYHATVDRVSVNVQGTITVRGRLRNYPLGYVLISTTGELSLASIRVPELRVEYTIVYDPDSRAHYLLDTDPLKADKLKDSPAVIPPPPQPEEQEEIKALQERVLLDQVANDSTATIDVMVVYTPAAKLWATANEGSISNVIAQAMGKGQLVADNSGTHFTAQLVYSAEVAYTESGDSEIDLERLQRSGDGYLDSVHTWRNTYGADLVVLFTKMEDTGGIGYTLNSPSGTPAYGFSITRVQQASWTYTTIHEIGHNMGLGHHKNQNTEPGPGLYPYSAGWRWISSDGGLYCSVMTYEDGSFFSDGINHTQVAYFSNPSILYLGTATGNATNGDNARTARETKNVIAAYRQATPSCTYTILPTSSLFSSSGNTGTVAVTTSLSSCAWTATSNNSWITVTSGSSGTGNGTVNYSVAANSGLTRTGTITIGGQTFTVTQASANANTYFDTVQRFYIGYYQRPADPPGLLYWAGRLDSSGGNFSGMIEGFANSAESQALYGTINSGNISAVVNGIYHALFGRGAEPGGLNFYVNGFNTGQFTAATIMLNVLYGAQGADLQSINNKLTAANLFTRIIDPDLDGTNFQVTYAGNADVIAARNFLALFATSVQVPTQDETTTYIKANIADPGDPVLIPLYNMNGTVHSGSTSGPVLSGATVSLSSKTATTSSAGTFTITGIPSGTYTLTISKPGYVTFTNPAYKVDSNQTGQIFYIIPESPSLACPEITSVSVNGIQFYGSTSYQLSTTAANATGTNTLTWGAYYQNINYLPAGSYSGSLRAQLFAIPYSFSGGTITNSYSLGIFNPNFTGTEARSANQLYVGFHTTSPISSSVSAQIPPAGSYCMVVFIEEYKPANCSAPSGYCYDQWVQFSGPMTFH